MKKNSLSEIEDEWFDFRLENDSRFLRRIESTRKSLREGKGISLDEVPE